ncbi:hypothetical protein ACQJBY_001934 [Aegilops geniculata]
MAIAHSTEQSKEKIKQRRAAMVKILEIGGGRLDAEEDDDCCEIDPAEFAKKLNLKASDDDDVVVVAAKGPIKVKVEVDQSEHSAETIPIIANGNGGLHGRIAGDHLDNPYEIDEDEPAIHLMESVEAKPDVKSTPVEPLLVMSDSELPFGGLFADMSPVKREPEDGNGADKLFAETIPDVPLPKSIPDMSPVKFGPEDGISGADEHEHEEEVIPDLPPANRDSECFEEVTIPDMPPAKCEVEGDPGAVDEPLEEEIVPGMSPLKCGSECFEEVVMPDMSPIMHNSGTDELFKEETIPDIPLPKSESENFDVVVPVVSPVKHEPEDGHAADERVGEEDGYGHLPEMDKLSPEGRVFDEEDGDDVVVVAKEAL